VAVHEYGHYIVGRWSGIQAEVFSLGFGPVLWSRTDRRGTRWQVAAVPLGGYVKFLGDANAASAGADEATMERLSPEERRHTMHGAPLWARAATVAAGPVFNFILSFFIFAGYIWTGGIATDRPVVAELHALPGGSGDIRSGDVILAIAGQETPDWNALNDVSERLPATAALDYEVERDGTRIAVTGPALMPPRIAQLEPQSAAFAADLRAGDVITAMDGEPIAVFDDIRTRVTEGQGQPVILGIWRDGQVFDVGLTPKVTDVPAAGGGFETRYLIGLYGDLFFTPATRPARLGEAVSGAASNIWSVMSTSVSALGHVVAGAISTCTVRGPITIAKTSGFAAVQGLENFVWFIAALSTAVGLLNLFPIPVLDGGHLVFHAYEWATGRPLPERALNLALSVGLFVVLSFMIFGLSNDIFCP
jgi:regulator of sigma E protease